MAFDGINFNYSGTVNVNGNSLPSKNYSFVDQFEEIRTTIFYRLKSVDNDGKYAYSKVVALSLNKTNNNPKLEIYPNPFVNSFYLNYESLIKSDAVVKITDLKGQKLYNKNFKLNIGINRLTIAELNSLPKGMYIIEMSIGNQIMNSRVIKF